MNISAVVLAAGKSSRTSGNHKLLLPLAGKAIIAHVVDNLLQTKVSEVIIITGHEAEKIQATLEMRSVRFVLNPNFAQGLSTSIKTGVTAVAPATQAVLLALGDMPFVEASDFTLLMESYQGASWASIAVPVFNGTRGNPVLFDICHRAAMEQLKGDNGCRSIIEQHWPEVLEVKMPSDNTQHDIDTIEEYKKLICANEQN